MILYDFRCEDCSWEQEEIVDRGVVMIDCSRCGGDSIRFISGTHAKTPYGRADSTGASQERPPWAMDTRSLAEGGTYKQWKRKRQEGRRDELRREIRDKAGLGQKVISYGK